MHFHVSIRSIVACAVLAVAATVGGTYAFSERKEIDPIPRVNEFAVGNIEFQANVRANDWAGIYVRGCDVQIAIDALNALGYKTRVGPVSTSFPMDLGPCMTVVDSPFDFLTITRNGDVKVVWSDLYQKSSESERKKHDENMRKLANLIFYH